MSDKSIWEKDIRIKRFKSLQKDIETGVLVIGAGITGLMIAAIIYPVIEKYIAVKDSNRKEENFND